ncbi:Ig-like domain-containing protein, partial [Acidobacteria bacterium AH-259-A15]|nr:Ig-like domain-containing protein [Acidobacteria bacterium AH-259-A15]
VSNLSVGSHPIDAQYSGDSSFEGSSTSTPLTQVVSQAATTTSLISSLNPSVFGQAVTLTATVTVPSPGTGTPTGTVTFSEGVTVLGTGSVDGSGLATVTVSNLSVGSRSIDAQYSGDSSFEGSSTSTPLPQTVNTRATTTAVSLNPSTVEEDQGSQVTVTVTDIEGAGTSSIPTGNVTFVSSVGTDKFTPVASCTLDLVTASCSVTVTASGGDDDDSLHTITASYEGSSAHTASSGSNNLVVDD